ncbi:unnamed protein product, partial [Meganyctiphanes norvegica]
MVIPIFLTCGPNEVLVVTGVGHKDPVMLTGGRMVVFPCFQTWQRMSLNVMTIMVSSHSGVYTFNGVAIKVTGVAQVKVSSSQESVLAMACEHFLDKSEDEVRNLVTETMEGHQRCIMGSMTVEDIYKNRKVFNERVFEMASRDLVQMGLQLLSYTIKDVSDDEGYLQSLGMARTSEVKRDARIGQADANKDATIQQAIADEELKRCQYANATEKADAERDFMLKKAAYDLEVNTKKAEADMAFELQSFKTRQKIKEEEMETMVVERKATIEVQEQEVLRKEKMLDATVKQPALAEKFKLETLAEANRKQSILESDATAEAQRLTGEAEAHAILIKAKADAAQMHEKAEAWKEYGEAAKMEMFLKTLPKMVAEISTTLSQTKSIKMVSSGDSSIGAEKLTREVIDISTSIPAMLKGMTGLDIVKV